jgi:Domain of unknown function (DUF4276)
MSRLRVAPIVEGEGEFHSIRILLQRLWCEMLGGEYIDVLQPIRQPRGKLVKESELGKVVQLARSKLGNSSGPPDPLLILILIDADEDCPRELGPKLLQWARLEASDVEVACVLANVEYETWFAAAAESLSEFLDLSSDLQVAENPEELGSKKAWVERRFRGTKYSETIDQPRMTAAMDLAACRKRSPSFDKLCRELERRLRTTHPSG